MLPGGSAHHPHPTPSHARASSAPRLGSGPSLSLPCELPADPHGGWFPKVQTGRQHRPGQRYLGSIDGLLVGAVSKQGDPELRGDAAKRGDLVGAGAAGVKAPLGGVV